LHQVSKTGGRNGEGPLAAGLRKGGGQLGAGISGVRGYPVREALWGPPARIILQENHYLDTPGDLLRELRFGLRLRAVGEKAQMVDAAGVSVPRLRYAALTLNGVLCALAGSYLVLAQNASFVPHMTAGRGFMALAAMIFGKWHPVGAFWACLLFGFLDAVAIRLQGVRLPGIGEVPVPAIQALPYVLTVVLLAGFIGRSMAPAELGRPYVKER